MTAFLDMAAPEFITDHDTGDEHTHPHPLSMTECPGCSAPREPEPTDEERQRLFHEPDYEWTPPEGDYLRIGVGLAGGGFGTYATCDRCDFFHKTQSAG